MSLRVLSVKPLQRAPNPRLPFWGDPDSPYGRGLFTSFIYSVALYTRNYKPFNLKQYFRSRLLTTPQIFFLISLDIKWNEDKEIKNLGSSQESWAKVLFKVIGFFSCVCRARQNKWAQRTGHVRKASPDLQSKGKTRNRCPL